MDVGVKVLLDGIAYAEGHGRTLSYNTTYAWGKYNGNHRDDLVNMTIEEVQSLQATMLANQKGNSLRSTALGRYQFIRKTLESCRKAFKMTTEEVFDEETQDKFAAYLLHIRGFDKWRLGNLSRTKFQYNLSKEWASIPNPYTGRSYYGQGVGIKQDKLDTILDSSYDNRDNYLYDQPPVVVDDPMVIPQPPSPKPVESESWFTKVLRWIFGG